MSQWQLACGMDEKKTSASVAVVEPQNNNEPKTTTTTTANPPAANHPNQPSAVEHHQPGGSWLCCMPCYWLRRNNSVHKASLTVATLLVTSLLVASPVLFLISAVPASDVPPRDCRFLATSADDGCLYSLDGGHAAASAAMLGPECSEHQCLAAAARVMTPLDRRVDPCTDFEKYSCGRWKPDGGGHSLVDMQAAVNQHIQNLLANSTGSFRKLGVFYNSCVRIAEKKIDLAPSKY